MAIYLACILIAAAQLVTVDCQGNNRTLIRRIAVLLDGFADNETTFVLSRKKADQIFDLAVDAGLRANVTRVISDNLKLTRRSAFDMKVEPIYLQSRQDLYKLYSKDKAVSVAEQGGNKSVAMGLFDAGVMALLELTSCTSESVDCDELALLSADVPSLMVVTTCCWRSSGGRFSVQPQPNIVHNTISADELGSFIGALHSKYGWKRFAYLMSPTLIGANDLFHAVNETLAMYDDVQGDNNTTDMRMVKHFYSHHFSAFYRVDDDLTELIGDEATAILMFLDDENDTMEVMQRLQNLEMLNRLDGSLLDDGKAYFLVEWSGFATRLPPPSALPQGLMLLRRRHRYPAGTFEALSTNSVLRRNLRHVFYEQTRLLSAAIRVTESVSVPVESSALLPKLFCDTNFTFEDVNQYTIAFDDYCQRRTDVFEVLNVVPSKDKSDESVLVPVMELRRGRLVELPVKPFWPGSGYRSPYERYCDLDKLRCPDPFSIKIVGPSIGLAVGGTIVITAILVILIRYVRRRGRKQKSMKDQVIARYSELTFFEDEDAYVQQGAGNNLASTSSNKTDRNTPGRMSSSSLAMNDDAARLNAMAPGGLNGSFGQGPDGGGAAQDSRLMTALFRGEKVFVKMFQHKIDCEVDDAILQELLEVHSLQHVNVNTFIAVTTDKHRICTIQPHCSKGTLAQVLFERKVQLDRVFKLSFASDIAAGMAYLHQSNVGSHGRLSADDILVDSRWFCRIANIPMPRFEQSGMSILRMSPLMAPYHITLQDADADMEEAEISENGTSNEAGGAATNLSGALNQFYEEEAAQFAKADFKPTTAPELLRASDPPIRGTKKADVYSYGIILSEIITRKKAYSSYNITNDVILRRVAAGSYPPFRPQLNNDADLLALTEMARFCMEEIAAFRPDFAAIVPMLRKMNNGKETNLVETMLQTMEHYAVSLEQMVSERTSQLIEEKKRSEELLSKMLPRSVVDELKANRVVNPEWYESVTVSFLDVVGFTKMASESAPIEIVEFLNDMYSAFDTIIESYDVYKVETISDSYMVASGLPRRNGLKHAGEIATMALDIMSCVASFKIRHRPGKQLQLRCGMHSGSVVAGIIGLKMPRYCLFGDTVNYASRMESSCLALRIQVSGDCKRVLDTLGGYKLRERGAICIKGKGEVLTYYLVGKDNFNKPMPDLRLAASLEEHEFK